jgi:long-chain fatty acid transport protein
VSPIARSSSSLVRPGALGAAVISAWCMVAGRAQASGFNIDEQDTRAAARAGAVVASPGNASTIYYNPAGIAVLSGVQIQLGASLVAPTAEFEASDTGAKTSASDDFFVLPQAFVSWRASELVSLGIGVGSPYGLALDWPATSPGRTSVRQAELQTLFIMPTFGFNLSKWVPGLALGMGVDVVPAAVRLTRDILFGSDVGSVALSGTAVGVGARAGVLYRPPALPAWSFGFTYRSPVPLHFRGEGDFDSPPAYRASLPPDGDVATSVTLPQTLQLGVMFAAIPEWEIEVDGSLRGWSSYDQLDIELPNGEVESSNRDWEDAFTVRIGTEYTYEQSWAARLGFIWDQTPIPTTTLDFQLPDANRIDVSGGFGFAITDQIWVDLSALYVLPQQRSTSSDPLEPPIKGTYEIDVWVFGLSIGVQLDGGAPALAPPASGGELTASE